MCYEFASFSYFCIRVKRAVQTDIATMLFCYIRQKDKPSPHPDLVPSTWKNFMNLLSWKSSSTPSPLSATAIDSKLVYSLKDTSIWPFSGVYFAEFSIKFTISFENVFLWQDSPLIF